MIVDYLHDSALPKSHVLARLASVLFFCGLVMMSYQKNLTFVTLMSDIIPASSLWKIIEHNPPLPYERRFYTIEFQEQIYKAVLGTYRPSYRSKVAQQAWKKGLPHQERAQADFAYHATFEDETSWKTDGVEIMGTLSLWLAERPGRMGAFPYQAEATLVLTFTFPQKAQKIVISDIHSQWAPGDVLWM